MSPERDVIVVLRQIERLRNLRLQLQFLRARADLSHIGTGVWNELSRYIR